MKRHIKKIISIALCISMMQPTLQAGPFQDFARKWVARGAAVGYWGLLSQSALQAREGYRNTNELRDNINSESILDQSHIFADLKDEASTKAAQIDDCLKQEGLAGLDYYRIKVLTDEGIERFILENRLRLMLDPTLGDLKNRKAIAKDLQLQTETLVNLRRHGSAASAGEKTIVVPVEQVNTLDAPSLAATLAHEMAHDSNDDAVTKASLHAATPFAIHAGCKGIYHALFGAPKNPPTITRSLLRIPRAGAILGASYFAEQAYSRECERKADKAVQSSPLLCRSLADLFERETLGGERRLEAILARNWQAIRQGDENLIKLNETLDRALATNMPKQQYVQAIKYLISLTESHPRPSERIAYLRKWAEEAETKKQEQKK